MKYLFVDESGDHNLEKIDPNFPLFVLTGIVFEKKEHEKITRDLISLKKTIFGTEKVILHSLELTRTNKAKQKEFKKLSDVNVRKSFYLSLNKLIKKHTFSIIVFVINKRWFKKTFPITPPDPYFLSFSYILSIFDEKLNKREYGEIYVERRNNILDKQFLLAWESAKATRVGLVSDKKLRSHHILKPNILNKTWNKAGLEIADLISYRLSRHFMGKKEKAVGNEIDLRIINKKDLRISGLPDVKNVK